ncbi:aldo/keto reductase, partial [uncultured Pseudomonas sp.]
YIGASSMYAWQFAKAQQVAASNGWSRFVSMQNFLNLLYREEEREMIPLCLDQGVGLMPWSPMARGRLTRPNGQQTERTRTDLSGQSFFENSEEQDGRVIDVVEQIAQERGVPMAQVALAWVLGKQGVSSPIVGASKPAHLDDALAAIDLHLTAEETARLEAPYVPHAVTGFK